MNAYRKKEEVRTNNVRNMTSKYKKEEICKKRGNHNNRNDIVLKTNLQ
jgi:uncharacterized protein YqeY